MPENVVRSAQRIVEKEGRDRDETEQVERAGGKRGLSKWTHLKLLIRSSTRRPRIDVHKRARCHRGPINHLPPLIAFIARPSCSRTESRRRCGLLSGPQPRRPRRTRSAPLAVRRVRRLELVRQARSRRDCLARSSLISYGKCRRGGQADDLVTEQGFEKRLKAAPNQAAHPVVVDLDLGDPYRARDLSRRRRADKCHLNSLGR